MNNRQSAAKQIDMRPIPGYEEYYLISKTGEIWSNRYNKFLKPALSKDGYLQVVLCPGNGKQYSIKVHRLVAMTFVENPDNKKEVNHIDYNRVNNFFENLEWVNHTENIKHSFNGNRYDEKYNSTKKAYLFTNVYNNKEFIIYGFRNLVKQLGGKPGNASVITRNANTGKIIKSGILKGLKVDIVDLDVRRPVRNDVESSDLKRLTTNMVEDMA